MLKEDHAMTLCAALGLLERNHGRITWTVDGGKVRGRIREAQDLACCPVTGLAWLVTGMYWLPLEHLDAAEAAGLELEDADLLAGASDDMNPRLFPHPAAVVALRQRVLAALVPDRDAQEGTLPW